MATPGFKVKRIAPRSACFAQREIQIYRGTSPAYSRPQEGGGVVRGLSLGAGGGDEATSPSEHGRGTGSSELPERQPWRYGFMACCCEATLQVSGAGSLWLWRGCKCVLQEEELGKTRELLAQMRVLGEQAQKDACAVSCCSLRSGAQ